MLEKIKKSYYYFYYKIYKFIEYCSEELGGSFWTDFKTGIVIIVLEIWSLSSVINYYDVLFRSKSDIFQNEISWILMVVIVAGINYYIFLHKDKWRKYIKDFDKLPKEKNKRGSWIVFGIVFLLIANFIFSFYLYYQV